MKPLQSRLNALLTILFPALIAGMAARADSPALDTPIVKNDCEISRDAAGIPAIRSANFAGASLCWGFLHGRDRAWQMDFLRRIAEGRRAEIDGTDKLRGDFFMRLMGFEERARKIADELPSEARQILEQYSRGVNQGFSEALAAGVYEFEDFGYQPAPWEPRHSIEMLLLQSFDQTRKTFAVDVEEDRADKKHAREMKIAELISRDDLPWDATILKKGEFTAAPRSVNAVPAVTPRADRATSLAALSDYWPDFNPGAGSNNWVIAPSRSATGNAWLANDPHLDLTHPPFWYWTHIQAGDLKAFGSSVPGFPFIASGTSDSLAWGLTNAYVDTADAIHVDEVELEAGAKSYRPVLWFRFGPLKVPYFFQKFRKTLEGNPVIPLPAPEGRAMVLRWTGFEIGPSDIAELLTLIKAKTAAEADATIARAGIPAWNIVFADTRGSIGFRVTGHLPRRTAPPAFGIPSEKLSGAHFSSYLTEKEVPHLLNPARGWIATANNRHWPKEAELHGGRGYSQGFRATRIEELITATRKHDLASLQKIQCDVQAVDARFLLPLLLKSMGQTGDASVRAARKQLESWDYSATLSCTACGVYRRWIEVLKASLSLDEAGIFHWAKRNAKSKKLGMELAANLSVALKSLGEKSDRPWGELHVNAFPHLAGPEYRKAQPIPTPGDDHSVNPGTANFDGERWYQKSGASQRIVVELTSPPRIRAVLPGPIADIPNKDLAAKDGNWKKWAECRYDTIDFPMDWSKTRETPRKITGQPAQG